MKPFYLFMALLLAMETQASPERFKEILCFGLDGHESLEDDFLLFVPAKGFPQKIGTHNKGLDVSFSIQEDEMTMFICLKKGCKKSVFLTSNGSLIRYYPSDALHGIQCFDETDKTSQQLRN